jgi:hypothetical protein
VTYEWQDARQWNRIAVTASGQAAIPAAESQAQFITEHYWGYTRQRDGGTIEYRVMHPRWNVWTASDARLDGDLSAVYGDAFAHVLAGPPRSAFVADGSPVTVFAPVRIR